MTALILALAALPVFYQWFRCWRQWRQDELLARSYRLYPVERIPMKTKWTLPKRISSISRPLLDAAEELEYAEKVLLEFHRAIENCGIEIHNDRRFLRIEQEAVRRIVRAEMRKGRVE